MNGGKHACMCVSACVRYLLLLFWVKQCQWKKITSSWVTENKTGKTVDVREKNRGTGWESDSVLTEIFEGLLDLFCSQVEVDVGWDERSVEPVVVVIAVYRVSSQLIMRQLLLKQTDDFHLRKISAVTHIWQGERERWEQSGTREWRHLLNESD